MSLSLSLSICLLHLILFFFQTSRRLQQIAQECGEHDGLVRSGHHSEEPELRQRVILIVRPGSMGGWVKVKSVRLDPLQRAGGGSGGRAGREGRVRAHPTQSARWTPVSRSSSAHATLQYHPPHPRLHCTGCAGTAGPAPAPGGSRGRWGRGRRSTSSASIPADAQSCSTSPPTHWPHRPQAITLLVLSVPCTHTRDVPEPHGFPDIMALQYQYQTKIGHTFQH